MMQLEHVNLVVNDIPETLAFYQSAFPHWRVRDEGEGAWSGKSRRWLHFGDDYHYLTFNDNGEGKPRDLAGHQPGLAHLGFLTHDIDGVIRRLAAAGFNIEKNGADEPYRRNVYFVDPSGIEVEFIQYTSDLPEQRNLSS